MANANGPSTDRHWYANSFKFIWLLRRRLRRRSSHCPMPNPLIISILMSRLRHSTRIFLVLAWVFSLLVSLIHYPHIPDICESKVYENKQQEGMRDGMSLSLFHSIIWLGEQGLLAWYATALICMNGALDATVAAIRCVGFENIKPHEIIRDNTEIDVICLSEMRPYFRGHVDNNYYNRFLTVGSVSHFNSDRQNFRTIQAALEP